MRPHALSGVVTFLAVLVLAGCATSRVPRDESRSAIAAALRAKTGGLGGCAEVGSPSVRAARYFPSVRFYSVTCEREHGDSTSVTVAVDERGHVHLLETDATLRYFLSVRPPPSADVDVIEYVREAATLAGRASATDSVAQRVDELPRALRATAIRDGAGQLRTEIREVAPGVTRVSILLFGPGAARYIEASLRAGGMIQVVRQLDWLPAPAP